MFCSCSFSENKNTDVKENKSEETQKLLANLHKTAQKGIMFGHHDDTLYGIGWKNDDGRSDVKSVCGDYPAVISFDLGGIEIGDSGNLDKVYFKKIKNEIVNHYNRGGLVSLSWHARNPLTGGDTWDVSDSTVVKSILPGGSNHEKFLGWLNNVSLFIKSLVNEDGIRIPVLFRPWHEHTGSWFWWGQDLCSTEEYKQLWRLTADCLKENGVDNVLYAYSPGAEPQDTIQYLERYPGDNLIDVLGFDTYQFDRDVFLENLNRSLSIIDSIGKSHNKLIAITEVGYESIPDAEWWTKTLLPVIENYSLSYVLVWRNACDKENHFYAPYPGHVSSEDFIEFYNNKKSLFASDIESLYK